MKTMFKGALITKSLTINMYNFIVQVYKVRAMNVSYPTRAT